MKVIFLDIDGVLNNVESGFGGFFESGFSPDIDNNLLRSMLKWDQACVNRVRKLVTLTGASIVMSSAWRLDFSIDEFKRFFAAYGWLDAPVIDCTPDAYDKTKSGMYVVGEPRAGEIAGWLAVHPDVKMYAILDDMSIHEFAGAEQWNGTKYQQLQYHYVETTIAEGFTESDVVLALRILGVAIGG